jgi:glycerate kinase
MEDIFLSTPIDFRRMLCISPLSARAYRDAGGKGLGGQYGYFIYECDSANPQSGIEVIAKAASLEAALKLYDIIVTDKPAVAA